MFNMFSLSPVVGSTVPGSTYMISAGVPIQAQYAQNNKSKYCLCRTRTNEFNYVNYLIEIRFGLE